MTNIPAFQPCQFLPIRTALRFQSDSFRCKNRISQPICPFFSASLSSCRVRAAWTMHQTSSDDGSSPSLSSDVQKSVTETNAMTAAGATMILRRAARAYAFGEGLKPSKTVVLLSIQELERVQRSEKVKADLNKLYGQWRLVFITSEANNNNDNKNDQKKNSMNPFRTTFFPLRAHQTFTRECQDSEEHDGEFDNGIFLLGKWLHFRIVGPFRWVSKLNRLEFSVDRLRLALGPFSWTFSGLDKEGYSLAGRTSKTLPFFLFSVIRDDIAVARGRSGGMALYVKVPKDKYL